MITLPSQANVTDASYRLLYINSYHRGYSWSDDIEQSMSETLKQSGVRFELSTEYLDSKRFDYTAIEASTVESMHRKYSVYKPDLLLISDNNAFNFVKRNREALFPNIPIVFSGFNNFTPDAVKGMYKITGVNEKIDLQALAEMAISTNTDTKGLAFIVSDKTASNKLIYQTSSAVFDQLRKHYQVEVLLNKTQSEIADTLALMPENSLVFIAGNTANTGFNRTLSPTEHGELIIDISPFPTFSSWMLHIDSGATGGHIVSGAAQGKNMANMALSIMSGTDPSDIPVLMETPTQDIFNYHKLTAFNINLDQLPINAIVLNKPKALWDTYKYHIITLISMLVIQMVLILVLWLNIRTRKQALKNLDVERSTLESRVLERTEALNLANKKLERLSLEDGLTGLKNRRYLDELLIKELDALRHDNEPLSLIMLDLDYFKQYNDIYGHIQGDQCLKAVSNSLQQSISRPRDIVARYGGEEFIIVLPGTNQRGAEKVVNNVRKLVSTLAITHSESPFDEKVTVSMGLITVLPNPELSLNVSSLLVLVDNLLYQAKDKGRNQVCHRVHNENAIVYLDGQQKVTDISTVR